MTNRLALLGLVLGVSAMAVTPAAQAEETLACTQSFEGDVPGPQMGEAAPALKLRAYNEDVGLKLVKSADIAIHDFVGIAPENAHKAVVLHFFSVDSERGVADLAVLQKLNKKYAEDGLMVIGVSVDRDQPERVYSAMEEARVGYPILKDRFCVVARRYGLRNLPSVYVVNAEGTVVSVREGYSADPSDVIEEELRELLR